MNRIFCLFFIYILFCNYSYAGNFAAKDSLGIESKDGKNFILHKVEAKETFYSISKRYNVTIDEIVANNLETKEGLKIDQILRIPYSKQEKNTVQNSNLGNKTVVEGDIRHQVKPTETLFSISKLYNVKIDDIRSWNNITGNELNIGQELIIKTSGQNLIDEKAVASENPSNTNIQQSDVKNTSDNIDARVVHTVEPSQTLFSISRMYNVSVDDLKKWNELEQSELSVGQKIIVKKRSQQEVLAEVKPEKKPNFTADNTIITEKFDDYDSSAQKTSKAEAEKAEKLKPVQTQPANSSGGSKIVELGFAEVIEGTDDTKKFRALHKTAPVGTIIQVKNEMNNLSVFVRVLGTLPNTGTNDKTLIKITKSAYERLGAIDPRFPVEISYVP